MFIIREKIDDKLLYLSWDNLFNFEIKNMKKINIIILFVLSPFLLAAQSFNWAKKISSTTNSAEYAKDITSDNLGNLYITGPIYNTTVAIGSYTIAANSDYYVAKLDSSGNVVWAKGRVETSGQVETNSISVDLNGNVFVTASYNGSDGKQRTYCAKFDSNGNYIAARTAGATLSNNSTALAGTIDGQNNFIIVGNYTGEFVFDGVSNNNGTSGFIIKYDNSLNQLFAANIASAYPNNSGVYPRAIAADVNGNIFINGYANGVNIDFDPNPTTTYTLTNNGTFTLKLDQNFNFGWLNFIQGADAPGATSGRGQGIVVGTNGNVYIAGRFNGTIDFDSGAATSTLTSSGTNDLFVLKMNSQGIFNWVKRIGGAGVTEYFQDITIDNNENIYLTGNFGGTVDFDPSTNVFNLSSTSSTDVFVTKLNSSGLFVQANKFGGSGANSDGCGVTVDSYGNSYATGNFSGTMDFNSGPLTNTLTGTVDAYLVKFSGCIHNAPNICLVTVDSLAQNNIIYWDKSAYPSADSFIVYRYDAFTTNYLRIGAKSFNQQNFLIDTARTIGGPNGGNPQYSSYRYKLAIKDLCGTMGTKGLYHESIFIQQNNQNFSWNAYGIEGQSSPATGYQFMRDNTNTGNWQVLVNTGGLSTTDPNYASYPNGNWRVDALGFSCNPTAKLGPNAVVNRSKSNVKNNFVITSASELELKSNVFLSPNPTENELEVHFSNHQQTKTEFVITDVLGKVVSKTESTELNKIIITLNDISAGVYFLKIKQGKLQATKKFVKE